MEKLKAQENWKRGKTILPPLENYQEEAIKYIKENWRKEINTLCALDVGMGKTRVACEILSSILAIDAEERLRGYALVCCPNTGLIETIWTETINNFNLKKIILAGDELKRIKLDSKNTFSIPPLTVCFITYLNLIKGDIIKYLVNKPPTLIIFDEYHTLTNNSQKKNQQYRNAIHKLPKWLRLGLTATPFVNNEMESVLAYGFLNDVELIDRFYSSDIEQKKIITKDIKEKHFLFIKENQYNLTKSTDSLISIPMDKEHYQKYLSVKEKYKSNHMKLFNQVGRLTISPSLLEDAYKLEIYQKNETGKIKAIRSIISHLPQGDKIVICDNYTNTLEYIMKLDCIRTLKPVLYIGGNKSNNKKSIESFNNKPEYRVLLTTRQEGGEGVNLQIANHLILLNCWYTAKDIIQILGRVKRKGQKKPVYTYILGYNLFGCTEINQKTDNLFLAEEELIYKLVRQKIEMCEDWGIEVKTKLPKMVPFPNVFTFEKEFNDYLERTIIKERPKISNDELNSEIEKQRIESSNNEKRRQAFYEREMKIGETYMDWVYANYINSKIDNQQNKEHRKKIKIIIPKKKF